MITTSLSLYFTESYLRYPQNSVVHYYVKEIYKLEPSFFEPHRFEEILHDLSSEQVNAIKEEIEYIQSHPQEVTTPQGYNPRIFAQNGAETLSNEEKIGSIVSAKYAYFCDVK